MLLGVSHLPAAQRYIGSKVSEVLGEKLGTQVSVGRVDLGFLNRMIIDDVLIYDQQQKEMLQVARLSAKVELMPLTEGRISISSAQLFGARARLYRKDAQSKPNYQFVLDSLASKDTTTHTPLDLKINSFIMRRSSVAYDEYDVAPTHGRFNPHHLHLSEISAYISLKALTDDSLHVNVRRLGFKEQSGLEVNRLTFHLEAGQQSASLEDLLLEMPSSRLQIDSLKATYRLSPTASKATGQTSPHATVPEPVEGQTVADASTSSATAPQKMGSATALSKSTARHLVEGTLAFHGGIKNSFITPSDLRCFNPSLKNFQREIYIETQVHGTDTHLTVPSLQLFTQEKDIDIDVNGWIEHWQKQPAWHLQMDRIACSEYSLDFLAKTFPQLPQEIKRIGSLRMNGTFDRNQQGTTSLKSIINSGAGDVDMQFTMTADRSFDGKVHTDGLQLQRLLADEAFGILATQIDVKGRLYDKQKPDITVNGLVDQLEYNHYTYNHITIDGTYQQGAVSGTFNIADPNIVAQLSGELTEGLFDGSSVKAKKVKMEGTVTRFVPAAVGLADWGTTEVSAIIDADFTAHTINDAQGSLRIRDFAMTGTENAAPYRLDHLTVTSGYDGGIHFVSLKSDFADAELKGYFDYKTLAQSVTNYVGSKLPTLPGLPVTRQKTDNNFSLSLLMTKSDWLQRFFGVDLLLTRPLSLNAQMNDRTKEINLDGTLPAFAYNGARYSDGMIRITSPADTMKCDVKVKKHQDDGDIQSIHLQADAHQNKIIASLDWDNHNLEKRMSGQLNSIISLYQNIDNKSEAHVRILPSHVILNNGTWTVEPSDILYAQNYLLVDHFAVNRGQQHIIIDGTASKHSSDVLTVDLNEVEVGYILDLVNFHAVEFNGKATGRAQISSAFGDFAANADLTVDEFKFEQGRMGVLHAQTTWNQERQQIDIHAVANDGPEAKTHINGFVSPTHNTIDLAIRADGTYIEFMHNFTKSFLSHITGHADGEVRLAGTLDNINLTGQLVVDGEASVTPLNTTYQLRRDTVVMIPDEIELRHMPLYDRDGHTGYLSGGIHHQHLTNLSYDLSVEANNLLAYDFNDFGENTFYGTVYATGDVAIHGRSNEVVIDCNVTPQRNSVFVYNAANPDAISSQEFIEWVTAPDSTATQTAKSTSVPNRATDTDIYINFLINATPAATLRLLMDATTKDYITLNGDGTIRATFHDKGAFNMFGTYTVDHGTYGITIQNIIKKNFTFNRGGTIVFGGDPYQAALNLQAVYPVNGVSLSDLNIGKSFTNNTIRVNCLMNIGGQPAAPQVDFDLEMPNVNADEQQMVRSVINGQQEMNQQVVYLLGIGRFYNQGVNNSTGSEQPDQASLAMQSFLSGTLSTQINTLLNQIIKNDNWNFGANISTGNEGWHNAEYEGIINGRMLNNRLLFNGQFGYRDNATQANPSFIGDFDVQYLLYPNGNLALKVYNQTNDRYFTKSSLNTQGIGLIMKKDFNGLRDLFTIKKKRKHKDKK